MSGFTTGTSSNRAPVRPSCSCRAVRAVTRRYESKKIGRITRLPSSVPTVSCTYPSRVAGVSARRVSQGENLMAAGWCRSKQDLNTVARDFVRRIGQERGFHDVRIYEVGVGPRVDGIYAGEKWKVLFSMRGNGIRFATDNVPRQVLYILNEVCTRDYPAGATMLPR